MSLNTEEIILKIAGRKNEALQNELRNFGTVKVFPPGTQVLRPDQYVKVVPVVISGLLKVYTGNQDKELLLYNIEPGESCIMSFSAATRDDKSSIYASSEQETEVFLLPSSKLKEWIIRFPDINQIFYQQFNLRYLELVETIGQLVFERLDTRLYRYLLDRSRISKSLVLQLSHRQIAQELGTAREVISRTMKKLEGEGKVYQEGNSIKIIANGDVGH